MARAAPESVDRITVLPWRPLRSAEERAVSDEDVDEIWVDQLAHFLGASVSGTKDERMKPIIESIILKIDIWEQMSPKELLSDGSILDAIFPRPGDIAGMFACVYQPGVKSSWRARMLSKLGMDGAARLFDQRCRLMNARTARKAALEERRLGGKAKAANDPKQKAKSEAFALWKDWQTGETLHKSGAAFARYVVDKLDVLDSTKTVERWVTQWHREAKASK